MIVALLAMLGLISGSFIDALVWRIFKQEELIQSSKGKSKRVASKQQASKDLSIVSGRSMCESCKTTLQPIDLIPVFSWLSTGGKCRYCRHPIGWQVPVIELGMSILFVLLYLRFDSADVFELEELMALVFWLLSAVGLVAIVVYDLRWMIIPNRIMLPMVVLGGLYVLIQAVGLEGGAESIKQAVLGLLVGGGLFYLLFAVSNGRWIGGGDVKLGFFLGLALGPVLSFVALWLAFVIALLVIMRLMILKRVTRKQPVPFGPFIILGIFIAVLWGQRLVDWYNSTLLLGA